MRCAALISAAGVPAQTERFLPMLKVDGTTMIKRQVQSFLHAGASPIVVVTGYHAAMLERHLAHSGVRLVRNGDYEHTQMIDSVKLGLAVIGEVDAVLIIPAAVPYLSEETLRALLACDTPIAVPQHGRRIGHPVLVRRTCFESLLRYHGRRGLRGFVEENAALVTRVAVDDEGVLIAVNTEERLQPVQAQHRAVRPEGILLGISLQYGGFSLDERLIRLLCAVSESGSLRSACAAGGISYSRAWLLLGEAERAIGAPLLVRKLGGASGGGSELTEEARTLIATYQRIAASLNKEAAHILEKEFTT